MTARAPRLLVSTRRRTRREPCSPSNPSNPALLAVASSLTAFTLPASPTGAATDRAGNLYSTGMFDGKADFDPDPATQLTLRASNPNTSPARSQYIAKYTEGGALVWALPLITDGAGANPGQAADAGAIAVDRAGNVYVSGHFNGAVDFDPARNTAFTLTTATGDGFVLKLDPSGHFVFATAIPNANASANLATAKARLRRQHRPLRRRPAARRRLHPLPRPPRPRQRRTRLRGGHQRRGSAAQDRRRLRHRPRRQPHPRRRTPRLRWRLRP